PRPPGGPRCSGRSGSGSPGGAGGQRPGGRHPARTPPRQPVPDGDRAAAPRAGRDAHHQHRPDAGGRCRDGGAGRRRARLPSGRIFGTGGRPVPALPSDPLCAQESGMIAVLIPVVLAMIWVLAPPSAATPGRGPRGRARPVRAGALGAGRLRARRPSGRIFGTGGSPVRALPADPLRAQESGMIAVLIPVVRAMIWVLAPPPAATPGRGPRGRPRPVRAGALEVARMIEQL